MTKSRGIRPPKRFWQPWEEEFLRQQYATALTADLAQVLDMPVKRVLAKANAMGLHKSVALISETARQRTLNPGHGSHATRIKPGQQPWNKGTHYVAGGRSAETRFKPGKRPHTWVPVGSYTVVEGVLQQKVNDLPGPKHVRWKPVSRLVWEKEVGPIPSGHAVVFRPGRQTTDPALITPDALECLSRAQLMARNTYHNLPPELASVVQLRGVLTRTINTKAKEAEAT